MNSRSKFTSKIGIILATAGSAVGLGNIWRFPYEAGQNGGSAFMIIYLCCIAALGIPAMVCEFIIGRNAQANATRAYGGWPWKLVGYMGVLTGFVIMGAYSVVAGWTLEYVIAAISGKLIGDADYVRQYFADFTSNPTRPIVWAIFFILLTHLIVIKGVQKGIEKASKVMMPLLFVLLVVLVISSLMLPRALEGVKFLLYPDFSQVTKETFLDALGQTFFSLSTGMAALVTYSSYFGKQVNLIKSAWQIATIDTIVAILASLMIFPAAFSVGIQPDSGPSLIFITLPNVFQQAFATAPIVGYIIGILFYLLLSLAALTSLISMHETPTAFVSEEFHLERKTGAIVVTVLALITSALCSLSIGAVPSLKVLGRSLFDFFDFLSANVLLTTGGFLTAIYVGWVLEHRIVRNQVTNWGTTNNKYFHFFVLSAKYICPTGIALIFLHQFRLI